MCLTGRIAQELLLQVRRLLWLHWLEEIILCHVRYPIPGLFRNLTNIIALTGVGFEKVRQMRCSHPRWEFIKGLNS